VNETGFEHGTGFVNEKTLRMKKALLSTGNLLIKSKVSAMLNGLGLELVTMRANDDLSTVLQECQPGIIIFDLGRNGESSVKQIQELRSDTVGFDGVILCFGPHVQTELLQSAENAGADIVIPNSVFSARGGRIIEEVLKNH